MIFEKQIVGAYKGMIFTRCDDKGTAFYFSAEDFEDLECKTYPFRSSMGHKLAGYIYEYENARDDKLIIFEHGFGGGHRSYMREIEKLCSHGYKVFAYDHTGCMKSDGATPNGMSQSLRDLNDCISTLRSDEKFKNLDISVVGHSWGGFSTLNIAALHPDITHIVAISGFVSVEMLINSMFSGILKAYRKQILKLEREANPDFVNYNAIETLKNSNTKALLLYSDNDPICKKEDQFDALKNALSDRADTVFLLEHNKGHNPNYSDRAVCILADFVKKNNKFKKSKASNTLEGRKKFLDGFDWWGMTEQDSAIWDKIFAFLET